NPGAGEGGSLDSAGVVAKRSVRSADIVVGWMAGTLVFDNVTLRQAAADLERRFGAHVVVDPILARRTVVARFHGESLEQVLDALGLAVGARYDHTGSTYTLTPLTPLTPRAK